MKQLSSSEITERLNAVQDTGRPMSGLRLSKLSGVPHQTLNKIEHRAVAKLRETFKKLHPALYGELVECLIK